MRKFVTTCIDEKTHYTMVLSEASYNVALDWLQREARKHDKDIYRTENNGTDDVQIYVGKPVAGRDYTGKPDVFYINTVIFHYDESRGYLMQE